MVVNSQIGTVSSGYPTIREFATTVTPNISNLEGWPSGSKLLRIPFLVRLGILKSLRSTC